MEAIHRSTHLALVAEVARAYLTWQADRELLRITEDTLRIEEEAFALIAQREREGIATQLDLAQARTSLETARANLALYQRTVAQEVNGLSLLVGGPLPADFFKRLNSSPEPATTIFLSSREKARTARSARLYAVSWPDRR